MELYNFRQYKNQKIIFSTDDDRRFTVIQGANGAGKTNLMNAITWCLYGVEYHIDVKYKGLPMINTTALEEKSDYYNIKVDIQLIQNDGLKMLISRSTQYSFDKYGVVKEVRGDSSLSLMRETTRDWIGPIMGADAQFVIDNLIPPIIEEYFFFDGERMDAYFKEKTSTDIKKAVFNISQLKLLENLIKHLTTRRNAIFKEAKKSVPDIADDQELLELHTTSLESDTEELEKIIVEKETAEKMETEYIEKLRTSSLEQVRSLENQREALKIDIDGYDDQLIELENDRLKLINNSMPILFAVEALLKTKNLIQSTREAGLIPVLYETIFIQNILDKNVCICGSDISEKDEYSSLKRSRVESYLDRRKLSDISTELIETNIQLKQMIQSVQDFKENILGVEKKIHSINNLSEDKIILLNQVSEEISLINVENIKTWEKERKKYNGEKIEFIKQIALLKKQIERRGNIIRGLSSRIKRELKKQAKHQEILTRISICDDGINAAKIIMNQIMIDIKNEVEIISSEQFLNLIWKKDTYTGIVIDDNYNISVPHVSGREGLGTLSAGERQVCALSFMAALNKVSGFNVPIIMDTPLARISKEPSKNIAQNLPNYLGDKQVTLLLTEKEYSEEIQNILKKFVGKEYNINVEEQALGNLAMLGEIN